MRTEYQCTCRAADGTEFFIYAMGESAEEAKVLAKAKAEVACAQPAQVLSAVEAE